MDHKPLYSSGEPVELKDWITIQMECAQDWSLTKEMECNERIHAWIAFFAQSTGELCKQKGVPVDEFKTHFPEFAERIIEHVDRLKWLLTERSPDKKDVGLNKTAQSIRRRIRELNEGVVQLEMMFPSADNPEEVLHIESVAFQKMRSPVMT